jgi:DNA-binding response OmpR family regulator
MKVNKISQSPEMARAPVQSQTNPPRRILVVEDEPEIRRINAMALHRAGYHVDTAEDGIVAWEALGGSHYDLMITDNNMPNLTGMQLLRRMHAARRVLPFIMATGNMPEEEFAKYPWFQPAATVLKPYAIEELLAAVKKVLFETEGSAESPQVSWKPDRNGKAAPQGRALAGASDQCPTGSPRRILVVEDEPDLRRLNAEVLENSGFKVDTAKDGMAGWEALHATRHAPESYALLITDHDMPGLSGLALVKKVRAARMALPVIMATRTLRAEELITRYPWLEPVATLGKPYSIGQLLRTVEAALGTFVGVREQIAQPPSWPSALTLECLELFVASKINVRPRA